jgi:hypothetical protein
LQFQVFALVTNSFKVTLQERTRITINHDFFFFGNVHLSNERSARSSLKRDCVRRIHTKEEISQHESVKLSFLHLRSWGGRARARERKQKEWQANGPRRWRARVCAGVFAAASNIHQRAVAHSKTNEYTNLFHAEHFVREFVCEAQCALRFVVRGVE